MPRVPEHAVLVLIDVQKGFDDPSWGPRNNLNAEENIGTLLTLWRSQRRPIVHIQHISPSSRSTLHPSHPGVEFKDIALPHDNEKVIQKSTNSAFIDSNLKSYLDNKGYDALVIVGLTTNHCVSTTARMAGNYGFDTYIVADATATFDRTGHDGRLHKAEDVHAISLANLHEEFATIMTMADFS